MITCISSRQIESNSANHVKPTLNCDWLTLSRSGNLLNGIELSSIFFEQRSTCGTTNSNIQHGTTHCSTVFEQELQHLSINKCWTVCHRLNVNENQSVPRDARSQNVSSSLDPYLQKISNNRSGDTTSLHLSRCTLNWFSIQSNGKKRNKRPVHLLFDEVHVHILKIESIETATKARGYLPIHFWNFQHPVEFTKSGQFFEICSVSILGWFTFGKTT